MKTFMIYAIVALVLMGTAGCEKANVKLTSGDLTLAEETGFPELFLLRIKGAGRNMRQLEGVDAEGEPAKAKGVTIDVAQDKAPQTVRKLQEAVPPGYLVFISEMNFGISGKPDQVSVLKAASPYDALAVMGTNGWNYDLSPDIVIARVKQWDKRFGLILRGVGFDWLEAEFRKQPPNMLEFAQEVYEFCPDVVDQGTETVEALAAEMKRTNAVYLWWD